MSFGVISLTPLPAPAALHASESAPVPKMSRWRNRRRPDSARMPLRMHSPGVVDGLCFQVWFRSYCSAPVPKALRCAATAPPTAFASPCALSIVFDIFMVLIPFNVEFLQSSFVFESCSQRLKLLRWRGHCSPNSPRSPCTSFKFRVAILLPLLTFYSSLCTSDLTIVELLSLAQTNALQPRRLSIQLCCPGPEYS